MSAFCKLASFRPRFLLESVEGGERLARYSFIGFGDGLEVRLDRDGLDHRHASACPCLRTGEELLAATARGAGARAAAAAGTAGMPLAGGLVGFTAYDVVRFFERLPARHARRDGGARCCTTWRRDRCWCSIT